jgi:hypothetical protein
MILDSPIISGSSTVTGNLTVLGTLTANVSGSVTSASYATNAETLDGLDSTSFTTTSSFNTASGSFSTRVTNLESFSSSLDATFATDAQLTAVSQSFSSSLSTVSESLSSRVANNEATGSSLTTASGSFSTRVTNTEATASSLVTASGSFSTRTTNLETASGSFSTRVTNNESNISSLQTASGSFSTRTTNLETASGSFSTRTTNLETASGSFSTRVTNAESSIISLNSKTGSYATTGSNIFNGTQTITGSLFITENLTVLGSSSISYVSQSTLNIGTNLITVNAQNPSIRFGGLAVIDSGSAPQVSGSWLFDSVQDRWIMIHQQAAGSALTSSIAIMGPETYNDLGNETTITLNRLVKGSSGASGEHISNSNISDTGTVVSINSATQITGSLGVTGASTFASSVTADSLNINTSTVFVKASIADTLTATSIGSNYNPGILNIQNKSATNGNLSLIGFQDASQFINLAAMGSINETHAGSPNSVTGALAFYTKTSGTGFISERMRITSAGNVGIGTTSPTTKLTIDNSANANTNHIDFIGYSSIPKGHIGYFSDGLYLTSNYYYAGGQNNDTGSYGQAAITVAAGTTTTSTISFALSDAGATSPSTKVLINSSGNVGIGTTSPHTLLTIAGATSTVYGINLGTQSPSWPSVSRYIGIGNSNGSITTNSGFSGVEFGGPESAGEGYLAFHTHDNGVSSAERMRIDKTGLVLIGTTSGISLSEGGILQVNSTYGMSITNGGQALRFIRSGVNTWEVGQGTFTSQTGWGLTDQTASKNALFIQQTTCNVGIGTTAPLSKLHVEGDARTVLTSLAGGDTLISAIAGVSNGYRILVDTSNNITYSWSTGTNTTAMTILNSGNVGIGTTSPSQLLTVYQDTNGDARLSLNNPNTGASARTFLYAITTGNRYVGMLAYGANATGTTLGLSNASLGTLEAGGDISNLLISSPSTIVFGANSSERMRITSGGDLYVINTTAAGVNSQSLPGAFYLEGYGWNTSVGSVAIQGRINLTGAYEASSGSTEPALVFSLKGSGGGNVIPAGPSSLTERMRITNAGNVGIGTTSPNVYSGFTNLQVNNSSGNGLVQVSGASSTLASFYAGNGQGQIGMTSNHPFILFTADVERMRITSGGNVGIGTTSPAASLHVVGNQYIAKSGGSGTYKQTVVGQTTAASSGTAKKIAYVGFTHSVRVYIWANQDTAHGSSAIADICTVYGASSGGTVVESNFGNVTDITVAYNNGGSPAYTIDVSVTYSGTAPTINYVIEGISHDNNIYTI